MNQTGLYTMTIGDTFYRSIYNSPKESELLFFLLFKIHARMHEVQQGQPNVPIVQLARNAIF